MTSMQTWDEDDSLGYEARIVRTVVEKTPPRCYSPRFERRRAKPAEARAGVHCRRHKRNGL